MKKWTEMSPRERDMLVAEKVFGWKGEVFYEDWDELKEFPNMIPSGKPRKTHAIDAKPVPSFTTHISAAKDVVEKMVIYDAYKKDGFHYWRFSTSTYMEERSRWGFGQFARSKSICDDICLAALEAIGVKI